MMWHHERQILHEILAFVLRIKRSLLKDVLLIDIT